MRRRPLTVTLLAWVVLFFAAVNLARLVRAIALWDLLSLLLTIWPGYLALSGLVWFPIGAALGWGLLRGRSWARRLAPVIFVIYSIHYWIERVFIPGDPLRNQNWVFVAAVNLLIVAWCIWGVSRSRVRVFFEVRREREPENQSTA